MVATSRLRLDELLVQRGYAPTREKAKALVLAGRVTIPGRAHTKPGQVVPDTIPVDVAPAPTYVSRGGTKLEHALSRFDVDPRDRICADIGASTGGFTDCLLQRGAARVYAIDVGYGQLDWSLRTHPRVVVLERTNARYLEQLPEEPDLVAVDASFISLRTLLPAIRRVAAHNADVVALIKPQFEAGRSQVGRGGVVRDPAVHRAVLVSFMQWMPEEGFELVDLTASPLRGPAGNVEFLAHLRVPRSAFRVPTAGASDTERGTRNSELIDRTLAEAGKTGG